MFIIILLSCGFFLFLDYKSFAPFCCKFFKPSQRRFLLSLRDSLAADDHLLLSILFLFTFDSSLSPLLSNYVASMSFSVALRYKLPYQASNLLCFGHKKNPQRCRLEFFAGMLL